MTLWVRYEREGQIGFGTLEGDAVLAHDGDLFAGATPTGERLALDGVRLLAPVQPRNFVGLWNNYFELAKKLGTAVPASPLWFLKSTGSILAPEGVIRPPAGYAGKTFYEGELGIVIGRVCANVTEAEAAAAIFGYTCVNDVTAADLFGDTAVFAEWARAKSCDTFGPVGPAIATGLDWSSLRIRVALNGRERQSYPAADMILPPARIVAAISGEMTLHPGDLIACGTSVGALPMRPGMQVEVTIEGIGVLRNRFGDLP
jgi:2-keto-4-pentenoate hydratase/2-oxohepta-3-ene-1,7-dioic acid hydratase in catechol pathway